MSDRQKPGEFGEPPMNVEPRRGVTRLKVISLLIDFHEESAFQAHNRPGQHTKRYGNTLEACGYY